MSWGIREYISRFSRSTLSLKTFELSLIHEQPPTKSKVHVVPSYVQIGRGQDIYGGHSVALSSVFNDIVLCTGWALPYSGIPLKSHLLKIKDTNVQSLIDNRMTSCTSALKLRELNELLCFSQTHVSATSIYT